MKAAVLHAPGEPLTIEDVEIAFPGPREVLVRTSVTGLCRSDLHFIDGAFPHPLPLVLGHEAAGIVKAVGRDVTYVRAGDPVVLCLSVFCGHCRHCLTGHPAMCDTPEVNLPPGVSRRMSWHGETLHQFYNTSTFAEQILVHEHAVVKIRPDMPLDRAALLGCAVLTGTGAIFHCAGLRPGESVAIVGCGGVGLAAINGAALAGAGRIIAIDTQPSKLALARTLGATETVDARDTDIAEAVLDLTHGGVDHAIECIGSKRTAEAAFAMLAPRGLATIVGIPPWGTKLELDAISMLADRRIQGSRMGSNRFRLDIPQLVDFYLQGRLKLDHMISDRLTLPEINLGFERMRAGTALRQIIAF
ncbi:Zn-dependent alcohol dehydrogenase [Acidisoma cladoniae]|uniref:Zn-dependent alcohol dehydrogenase n=1 Tax=Acidisoma cladoniae TaxID=3040935 RepID=UPI00254DD86F|nr:Zn-dependent alcohol dehydrogenase [Acidisoma sp. PAMC 29798]